MENVVLLLAAAALIAVVLLLLYAFMTGSAHADWAQYDSEKWFYDPKSKSKHLFPEYTLQPTLSLTVVVPAYNEEKRLPTMMEEAMDYLEKRCLEDPAFTYEVIIVDDGSTDQTTEVGLTHTEKYGSDKVRVLTLQKNRGKGGAVRLGVLSSRGKQILFADADGASKFSDLDKLSVSMSAMEKNALKWAAPQKVKQQAVAGVVCGSRAHLEKESIVKRSLFRTFLMLGFHFVVWLLCVRGIKDTQCGFKLLTREAAIPLFLNLHVERWAFDVDLLYIAQRIGFPVSEVAIDWHEIEGTKMVPVLSWLQMGRDIILIRLRYTLGIWKIKTKF